MVKQAFFKYHPSRARHVICPHHSFFVKRKKLCRSITNREASQNGWYSETNKRALSGNSFNPFGGVIKVKKKKLRKTCSRILFCRASPLVTSRTSCRCDTMRCDGSDETSDLNGNVFEKVWSLNSKYNSIAFSLFSFAKLDVVRILRSSRPRFSFPFRFTLLSLDILSFSVSFYNTLEGRTSMW